MGADDSANAVAVHLETAGILKSLQGRAPIDVAVRFVSFALEEPPVFNTRHMGKGVHTARFMESGEKIDGE